MARHKASNLHGTRVFSEKFLERKRKNTLGVLPVVSKPSTSRPPTVNGGRGRPNFCLCFGGFCPSPTSGLPLAPSSPPCSVGCGGRKGPPWNAAAWKSPSGWPQPQGSGTPSGAPSSTPATPTTCLRVGGGFGTSPNGPWLRPGPRMVGVHVGALGRVGLGGPWARGDARRGGRGFAGLRRGAWLGRRTWKVVWVKTPSIAAVWATATTHHPELGWDGVLWIQRFVFIAGLTLPFDIRDLDVDRHHMETLPQVTSPEACLRGPVACWPAQGS